ncbi:MAG TPA: aryl-sulfate sulfotransferase [Gemmataceae bacterium]|nr:aryl-sulfate sulfotransferase [Gemmataceae bacterium]
MKQLLALFAVAVTAVGASLQGAQNPGQKDGQKPKQTKAKVGLTLNDPKAFQGYTMFSPGKQKNTFLIDMQGRVVKIWEGISEPGIAYLLPNGNLLRTGKITEKLPYNPPPGLGGRIQEYTWEGELVWDYKLANDQQAQHHDICALPNGNVLCVAWDRRTAKEVLDAGRVQTLVGEMLPDSVIEIKKTGKNTAEVVWEWRVWDHLIQDYDRTKNNFGDVAAHPELVHINYGSGALANLPASAEELQKLKKDDAGKKAPNVLDWTHVNAIAYNADLDQIILSVHEFSEFWVIDHSTTTAGAKGHAGGKSRKGGDLLYRWGNPAAYRSGTAADRQLFVQHNAHWIPKGLPGAGNILVFNNGGGRKGGNYTSIDEIVPPLRADGKYAIKPGAAFGPDKALWSFSTPKKTDFYAYFISSAQRLPNGNTFICAGDVGRFFEVTPQKDVVWEYINPVGPGGGTAGGKGGLAGTTVFRAYRVSPDHPGLAGRTLTPGKTLEEWQAAKDSKK